jgi:hypothetical protein
MRISFMERPMRDDSVIPLPRQKTAILPNQIIFELQHPCERRIAGDDIPRLPNTCGDTEVPDLTLPDSLFEKFQQSLGCGILQRTFMQQKDVDVISAEVAQTSLQTCTRLHLTKNPGPGGPPGVS